MSKSKRTIDPALLPHARPCWCQECTSAYRKLWWKLDGNSSRYSVQYLHLCLICKERYSNRSKSSCFCSGKCRAKASVRIGYCIEPGCGRTYASKGKRRRCDLHFKGRGFTPAKKLRLLANCQWCFADFERIADHETHICCSKNCLEALKRQLRKFGTTDRSLLPVCLICRKPTFRDQRAAYCEYHSRRAADQAKIADGRNNLKNAKRRSATHDGDAGITVAALRARDGDFCRSCGFKIDFDAAQYDDLAPEIDHIVPLALEGTHTWDNVQLLHGRCNRSKGARLIPDRPTLFDEEIA